jgi:UDP-N-acetylglucosamine/UDP-N-acetyl-alpha-D-glucosaminouronate 4-epimerase
MADSYLVTGGAGFIGNHIVRALLERGHTVRVFDNFSTGHRENLTDILDRVELVEGDLRSIDACRRAVKGITCVLHQAALLSVPRSIEDPHTTHEVNATGTLHLLVAARDAGARRVVYASSSSVYGPELKLPRAEHDRPNPISPYAVSKLAGEQYCLSFHHAYGLETVALRYFNIFGPRQGWDSPYAGVLPRFIRALRRGEAVTVFGDGEQSRDFTFVANAVDANLRALTVPAAAGRVYNVGAGRKASVNDLLALVARSLATRPVVEHAPPRTGDVRDSLADLTAIRRDLGYEPTVTLEEGLRRTVEWNVEQEG